MEWSTIKYKTATYHGTSSRRRISMNGRSFFLCALVVRVVFSIKARKSDNRWIRRAKSTRRMEEEEEEEGGG